MFSFVSGGSARKIGASFHVLGFGKTRVGIDGGLCPGVDRDDPERIFKLLPDFSVSPKLDYLLVTHGHLDHAGSVPAFFRKYENLKVFMTRETYHIAQLQWEETIRIGERDKLATPFDRHDIELAKRNVYLIKPHQTAHFTREGFSVRAIPAGHILGAVSFIFTYEGQKIFVTGDFSSTDQETIEGAVVDERVDVLISEATYAGKGCVSRVLERDRLRADVLRVIARGGSVIIPSFAIQRAQDIFEMLHGSELFDNVPLYLDGLSTQQFSELYRNYIPGKISADITDHFVPDWEARKKILTGPPCVVIASSGMLEGGMSTMYTQKWCGREENAIFFPGYIDPCSPGAKVLESPENGIVSLGDRNGARGSYTRRAEVGRYHFSAHANAAELTRLREVLVPKLTLLVHGEYEGMKTMIREEGADGSIYAPRHGEIVSLA